MRVRVRLIECSYFDTVCEGRYFDDLSDSAKK